MNTRYKGGPVIDYVFSTLLEPLDEPELYPGSHQIDWKKWTQGLENAVERERDKVALKAYNKIMKNGPHRIPKPVKDSPMELTRDAEVWNDVVEQFYKAINAALAGSETSSNDNVSGGEK